MNAIQVRALFCLFGLVSPPLFSQDDLLPPSLPWSGKSEQLVVPSTHPWVTLAEKTGFVETPRYDETMRWFEKLVATSPNLKMISIGKSAEGRDIWAVIASKEKNFTPQKLKASKKSLLMAQAGIHSGEIDGKDAGMMLLRDMTVVGTKKHLLDRVNFMFIPIFNVDGHERFSAYSRVNQRGPKEMGWRTTSKNLNLNRDFAKLDSPEMRSLVQVMQTYDPDFFCDIHVTDGWDYQYDVTIYYNPPQNSYSPASAAWIKDELQPALFGDLSAHGHIPGMYVGAFKDDDIKKGFVEEFEGPRYSSGYGSTRHIPSILVENHSLKPYKQRVLGTYVLLESILRSLGEKSESLKRAIDKDRTAFKPEVVLDWEVNEVSRENIEFLTVASQKIFSPLTKSYYEQWLGKAEKITTPLFRSDVAKVTVKKPKAYVIPGTWSDVIARLRFHGVSMETFQTAQNIEVEAYRLVEPKLATKTFEGHVRVDVTQVKTEKRQMRFAPGSVRIPTDQRLGDLVVLLLEPQSPDSFFQWGMMHEILQPTEYIEEYVMQPLAKRMIEADPALKAEYEAKKKKDKSFAKDAAAQMEWFYRKTPYADDRFLLYPIAKEVGR